MAGRVSVIGAQTVLNAFFSKSQEAPDSFYLALIREVAPTPYLSGEELDEIAGLGYQRAEIPNDTDNWSNTSQPFTVANAQDITFSPATDDWGAIRYWALTSSPAGGVVYFAGDMENQLYINNGDQVLIAEGTLSVSLGPFFAATDN